MRVIQFGFLALFVHFGDHTIFAQQKPRTEFFKSDQVDSFDEINEKLMKINEDNCGIKVISIPKNWIYCLKLEIPKKV